MTKCPSCGNMFASQSGEELCGICRQKYNMKCHICGSTFFSPSQDVLCKSCKSQKSASKVDNERDLGKELHNGTDCIEIEGNIQKGVIKIKASGKVAWGLLIGALGVSIPLVIATVASAGTAAAFTGPALVTVIAPVSATLGVSTTITAVGIAAGAAIGANGSVSAGSDALKKLRKYKAVKIGERLFLIKK